MRSRRYFNGREWTASLVLGVLGLAVSASIALYVNQYERDKKAQLFQQLSVQASDQLTHILRMNETALRRLSSTLQHKSSLPSEDLLRDLQNALVLNEESGTLNVGFIRRVAKENIADYIAEQQRALPLFQSQNSAINSDEYFVVERVEPYSRNWDWLGLKSRLIRGDVSRRFPQCAVVCLR